MPVSSIIFSTWKLREERRTNQGNGLESLDSGELFK